MTDDVTEFTAQAKATDTPAQAERRAHAWKVRERMGIAALGGILVAEAVVLWVYYHAQTEITKAALDAELIALSVVVVFFIGGKAGVEALVSLRTGTKPS